MEDNSVKSYGCGDYRLEMMFIGLVKTLEKPGLSETERKRTLSEIKRIKAELGVD